MLILFPVLCCTEVAKIVCDSIVTAHVEFVRTKVFDVVILSDRSVEFDVVTKTNNAENEQQHQ